jgi:TPR repeat protein
LGGGALILMARMASGILAGLSLSLVTWCGALAETRMALVIGNSNYAHGGRLSNPVNDAAAVAKALTSVGFQVVSKTDLGRDGLDDALKTFARDSGEADVALVYYAGHGMEIGGTNYLIPIDATLASDTDIEYEAVPVDRVLTAVGRAHRLKVVILDACRNNPYVDTMRRTVAQRAISVGLARPVAASGMLIAYAAREGSTSADGTGADSPYATALVRHLSETGVDVRILFGEVHDDVMKSTGGKQEPSNYDSIGGAGYYLTPPTGQTTQVASRGFGEAAAPSSPAVTVLSPDAREVELRFWEAVDASDPVQLKAYLDKYPKGTFTTLAQAKLAQTKTAAAAAPAAPKGSKQDELTQIARQGANAYRTRDFTTAQKLWRQAADQGSPWGQFGVGLLNANGLAGPRNYVEAMRWYRLAAAQGFSQAENNIGNLYANGRGVAPDPVEAIKWYRQAATQGNSEAQLNLGIFYAQGHGTAVDYAEAMRWLQMAASQGEARAWFNIGLLYRGGFGVAQDFKEAARWFRMAADQNIESAQFDLGLMYENGRGVDRDPVQARAWIDKAAAQGLDAAKLWLSRNTR